MSEPEEVILDGAHAAATMVGGLWRRNRVGPRRLELEDVRRRLELLVGALHADSPPISVAEPPSRPSILGRLAHRVPRHMVDLRPLASTDGNRLRLPRELDAASGEDRARATYVMLALQQAARAARGTPRALAAATDPLTRDLYLLAEAVAVDLALARELPGMVGELVSARSAARPARAPERLLTQRELEVERLLMMVLDAHPASPPADVPAPLSPGASLRWARDMAATLECLPGRYRGIPLVAHWGRTEAMVGDPQPGRAPGPPEEGDQRPAPERVHTLTRRPRARTAPDDEDDEGTGMWMIQIDDPQEHVEDPMGLQRPTDRDDEADAGDLADSLSELPEARLVASPGSPAEILVSEDPPERQPLVASGERRVGGIAYPEWDYRAGAYHPAHAIVRPSVAPTGDMAWVEATLARHGQQVRQVRRRFERLRPQRVRLGRQADGGEVDLEAYVSCHADLRAGRAPDDRLYESVRPMRRDIAIMLLVDVSGSTDSWVADQRRIIDVEKEAVLLVCEALDALGDRYGVLAFSGQGPEAVSSYLVKEFGERYGPAVRGRIAGLEPEQYTRSGAAIRHATAALTRENARHRLLLILSDGKPNDVDVYEGRYGVEDTRQAVAEARLEGLHPFCVTVDRAAPSYISRIYGPRSYAVLRRATNLPQVLIEVVRRLLVT